LSIIVRTAQETLWALMNWTRREFLGRGLRGLTSHALWRLRTISGSSIGHHALQALDGRLQSDNSDNLRAGDGTPEGIGQLAFEVLEEHGRLKRH
jgi:hypothetical protein